jgi:hypothetical protein
MIGFGIDGKLNLRIARLFNGIDHVFGSFQRYESILCSMKNPDRHLAQEMSCHRGISTAAYWRDGGEDGRRL